MKWAFLPSTNQKGIHTMFQNVQSSHIYLGKSKHRMELKNDADKKIITFKIFIQIDGKMSLIRTLCLVGLSLTSLLCPSERHQMRLSVHCSVCVCVCVCVCPLQQNKTEVI